MAKHKRTSEAVNIHRYHVATHWSLHDLMTNQTNCKKCQHKPIKASIEERLFISFHNLGEIMLGEQIHDFVSELRRQGLVIKTIEEVTNG